MFAGGTDFFAVRINTVNVPLWYCAYGSVKSVRTTRWPRHGAVTSCSRAWQRIDGRSGEAIQHTTACTSSRHRLKCAGSSSGPGGG